jgi:hypothetical protein
MILRSRPSNQISLSREASTGKREGYPTGDITDAREACWDLPADIQAAGKARRLVRDALDTWGLPTLTEHVTAVVSELVTNAIVHSSTACPRRAARKGVRGSCGGTIRGWKGWAT